MKWIKRHRVAILVMGVLIALAVGAGFVIENQLAPKVNVSATYGQGADTAFTYRRDIANTKQYRDDMTKLLEGVGGGDFTLDLEFGTGGGKRNMSYAVRGYRVQCTGGEIAVSMVSMDLELTPVYTETFNDRTELLANLTDRLANLIEAFRQQTHGSFEQQRQAAQH